MLLHLEYELWFIDDRLTAHSKAFKTQESFSKPDSITLNLKIEHYQFDNAQCHDGFSLSNSNSWVIDSSLISLHNMLNFVWLKASILSPTFCLLFIFPIPSLSYFKQLLLLFFSLKIACFMDIVVGIDVSSQRQGDHVFHGQSQLETYLPKIIKALTSLQSVTCNAGSQSQASVALHVNNTDPPVTSKFHIDSDKLLNSLVGTTIKNASHLDAKFLDSLWQTFQIKSANRRKVSSLAPLSWNLAHKFQYTLKPQLHWVPIHPTNHTFNFPTGAPCIFGWHGW